MPFARSFCARSSAFAASPTDTTSGRCRSIWPTSSSKFEPAASATTRNGPGSEPTTARHCRPIDPVEPKMANFVKDCVTNSSSYVLGRYVVGPMYSRPCFGPVFCNGVPELRPRRVDQGPIIPDNRNGQNQRVDTIKDPAGSRQHPSRIIHAGAALVTRLQQVSDLARDISRAAHGQQTS